MNAPVLIAPSVLAADYGHIAEELADASSADLVHLDVMDGHFVPNISFGVDFLRAVKESTSLPVGGASTHAVLAGHNGLPSVKIFDRLDELEPGDYFVIQVLGEDHAYRIYDIETVLPEETQSLVIQQGRDLCTLVTCTPYGVNTHRLLVHAERCDVPDEWLNKDAAQTFPDGYAPVADRSWLTAVGIGLLVAVVLIAAATLALRAVKRRRPVAEVPGGSARSEASSSPGRPVGVLPVLRGSGAARRAAADRAMHRGKRGPDRNGRESDVRRGGKHFRE